MPKRCPIVACQRHLFGADILGLDGVNRHRVVMADRHRTSRDDFMQHMINVADGKSDVFTEDLKTFMGLADSDDEVRVLVELLKSYCSQERHLSHFAFGPSVLRLLHMQDKAELAWSIYNDKAFEKLFEQLTSCIVLMDLLYKQKKYEEVVQVFEQLKTKKGEEFRYPVNCTTLLLAAHYQLNTPASLAAALEIIRQLRWKKLAVTGRAIAFISMLALNQNQPSVALELCANERTLAGKNIKVMSFALLDRPEDAIQLIKSSLGIDKPYYSSVNMFFTETLSTLEEAMKRQDNPELAREVLNITKALQSGSLIRDDTFKGYIEGPIHRRQGDNFKSRRRSPVQGSSYQQGTRWTDRN